MNVGLGNQNQIKLRRCNACGFAQNNRVSLVVGGDNTLFDVCTRRQLSLKAHPTLSSQQELGRGPVIKHAAERLGVWSLKSSEKIESFSAGRDINRPERAESLE